MTGKAVSPACGMRSLRGTMDLQPAGVAQDVKGLRALNPA